MNPVQSQSRECEYGKRINSSGPQGKHCCNFVGVDLNDGEPFIIIAYRIGGTIPTKIPHSLDEPVP